MKEAGTGWSRHGQVWVTNAHGCSLVPGKGRHHSEMDRTLGESSHASLRRPFVFWTGKRKRTGSVLSDVCVFGSFCPERVFDE